MALLPSDRDPARGRWEVAVVTGESGPLLTVRANQASALSVLREIARARDLGLSGADHLEAAPSLTANLDSRPLDAALGWLLGSLGSRVAKGGRSSWITIVPSVTRASRRSRRRTAE